MNTKQLVSVLSHKNKMSEQKVTELLQLTMSKMCDELVDGKVISVKGFGAFEVKKKNERVLVQPITGIKMLVPPKLVLSFKQSTILKDKLKGTYKNSPN